MLAIITIVVVASVFSLFVADLITFIMSIWQE